VPHRGKRNEPAFVRFVAETIANVKNIDFQEVARVTTDNVTKLFRIWTTDGAVAT
jgi:TatD DNase family protein